MALAGILSGVGSALAGVASAASSLQVGLGGKKKQRRAFEYNRQLMDQQFEHNAKLMREQQDYALRMWNMENEYNSPVNQMKRFEEAGLNPALMYTRGDSGAASQVGGYDTMPVDYSNYRMGPDNMPMDDLEVAGRVMDGIAKAVSTVQDLTSKQQDIESKRISNVLGTAEAEYADALAKYKALGIQQRYYLSGGDLTTGDADIIREGLLNQWQDRHYDSMVDRMLKQRQISLSDYQKKELKALIANRWRDVKLKDLNYDWQSKEKQMWEKTIYPQTGLGVVQPFFNKLIDSLLGIGSTILSAGGKAKIIRNVLKSEE